MNLKGILFGGAGGGSAAADFGLLLLRLGAGIAMAWQHGLGKVPVDAGGVKSAAALGFPMPEVFAWLAALAELVGGILVAVGLLTRPASFFVVVTMAVAFFMRHGADDWSKKEKAFLFGLIFLVFLFTGAGRFSIDNAAKGGTSK